MIAGVAKDVAEPPRRHAMFQDSLSEGHVYYGRMLAIAAAVTTLAYLFSAIH
jgi:hypothetical protein